MLTWRATVWTLLEAEGLGCNMRHYSPMIDARVSEQWNIPLEWSLKSQLVFSKPTRSPREKILEPLEKRAFILDKWSGSKEYPRG